jgi:hypothetical protein
VNYSCVAVRKSVAELSLGVADLDGNQLRVFHDFSWELG